MNRKDFGIIFWIHILVIVFIYLSPFFVHWKYLLVLIGLYYLQLMVFGYCLLTRWELKFQNEEETFYGYYLSKLGVQINKKRLNFILNFIMPWTLLLIALVWQEVL